MTLPQFGIATDGQGCLRCPACNDTATHIDSVLIAAREEDREFNEIAVNAISGQIQTHRATPAPMGSRVKEGRRQRIALPGWCEVCGANFAIIFTQHKGVTFVEVVAEVPDEFRTER